MIQTEMESREGRMKEGSRGIVGRDRALEDLSVDWRATWVKGGRNVFREVEYPADQASPHAVREHILSRCVGQVSDHLARHANHRCRCFAAFAEVKLLPHHSSLP